MPNIIFHLMSFVCMFIANYLIFSILLVWPPKYNNSTNILIWSKHSTNLCGSIIWVPKLVIKVSNDFGNGGTYIVYKWIQSYKFSCNLKVNIELFHTLQNVRTCIHLKIDHNLVLTIILQNLKLHK